jgi:hypothetical protein
MEINILINKFLDNQLVVSLSNLSDSFDLHKLSHKKKMFIFKQNEYGNE